MKLLLVGPGGELIMDIPSEDAIPELGLADDLEVLVFKDGVWQPPIIFGEAS